MALLFVRGCLKSEGEEGRGGAVGLGRQPNFVGKVIEKLSSKLISLKDLAKLPAAISYPSNNSHFIVKKVKVRQAMTNMSKHIDKPRFLPLHLA
ncbi:unnamed protein product [Dovyalis caffra]|uniref:Uncharacterized protein n=1 Tax=Dovyalis caffra TaxID=77055 RepID=A0AAV1RCE7_9ROSI|nr:unnamed protein product [Dovyalis caffra]